MNFKIFNYDEVSSTNDLANAYAAEHQNIDAVFTADSQTNGRGRRGRSFYSPKNSGLYISFLIHPEKTLVNPSLLTCMTAVVICRSIEEVCGIYTHIKWVNDIYYEQRKICGILTEGKIDPETGSLSYAVIGAGLNLFDPDSGFPDDIKEKAGALISGSPDYKIKNKLFRSIIENFSRYCDNYDVNSFIDEYRDRSMLIGKYVKITGYNNRSFPDDESALVTGIDDNCRLLVRFKDGSSYALESGEVSVTQP